ncbi:hypothetical protein HY620_00920 [Candidatus Uhrbacteria bacterium]|nr:hypothetical protein [Candidatus Uhrbacteria bacterium]
MTKFRQMGKKALNVVVTSSVITWSVGFAALAPVSAAPSLMAGDLIKASGPAVYYYTTDGKRAPFPNDKVFKSWYADYSMVKTITDAELAAISLSGTNMTYRAGTRLVKITTDPKTYAVEPGGSLRWIKDEATAKALYGDTWNKQIDDVADVFFTNYSKGADVASATPTVGSLVKTAGSADIHYIDTTGKRKFSDSTAFAANGVQLSNVRTVADSVLAGLTTGAPITGKESALAMPWGGSTPVAPTNPAPSAGTALTVALGDTPATTSIVADTTAGDGAQAQAKMLALNLTAGSAAVKVTTLKLKRLGISADTDVANAYLYDGSTRLAEMLSLSSGVLTFSNAAGLVTVPASSTKSVWLKIDLTNGTTSGKTLGFSLNAAADVTTDGATVSGTFPVSGNLMSTASVGDLGKLTVANVSPTGAATVDPGQENYQAWRFSLQAQDQKVEVSRLAMTLIGSVATTDLANFDLYDGATKLGSVAALPDDKVLVYDLSASPLKIDAGVTKNLDLKLKVVGGSSRTFKFSFQKQSDIVVKDANYNIYLKPNQTDTFTVVQSNSATTNTTINSGSMTTSINPGSPSGNVALGDTNGPVVAKFDIKATGEALKVTTLTVSVASTGNAGLDQGKVVVNGTQLGSTADITAAGTAFTFGNSLTIAAGQTATIAVHANLVKADGTAYNAGDTATVSLAAGNNNVQGLTSLSLFSTSAVAGRTLTLQSGTLSIGKSPSLVDYTAAGPVNPTGALGGVTKKIGAFFVKAGTGEGVNVTQLVLTDNIGTNADGITLADAFSGLSLKNKDGKDIGSPASQSLVDTDATTYTFTFSPALALAADQEYIVNVYSDIRSSLGASLANVGAFNALGATQRGVSLTSVSGTGASTNRDASATLTVANGAGQANVLSAAGTVTASVETSDPIASSYAMGMQDQTLAKFKLTASAVENHTLTRLSIHLSDGDGTADEAAVRSNFQDFELWDVSGATPVKVNAQNVFNASTVGANSDNMDGVVAFSGLSYTLPKDTPKTFALKADAASYPVATSGAMLTFSLQTDDGADDLTTAVAITGADSGATATVDPAADQLAAAASIYRSKLSVAYGADSPSGASSGQSGQLVAKMVFTNTSPGGYDITLAKYKPDLASTITIPAAAANSTTLRDVIIYRDSIATANALATLRFCTRSTVACAASAGTVTVVGYGDNATGSFTTSNVAEAAFTDLVISAGQSRTLWITADTPDAVAGRSFSVNVGSNRGATNNTADDADSVNWTDGVTAVIDDLNNVPIAPAKTVTY